MCYSQGIGGYNLQDSGGKLLLLVPEELSSTGYVKRPLLFRDILRLWDYPGDLTQRTNEYQLLSLCKDIHPTPPANVLASYMEAVINSQPLGKKISIEYLNVEKKRRR